MEGIHVRRATPSDVAALAELIGLFGRHTGEAPARIPASLARLLEDPGADFLMALAADGRTLGYAQLRTRYSLWLAAPETELEDLFVREAARGAGVGSALLSAVIDRARERGGRALLVGTNEANAAALSLYRRAGFAAERPRWRQGRQLLLRLELP